MSEHVFAERDGKLEFVGNFDALYREESDPWGQSAEDGDMATYYDISRTNLYRAILANARSMIVAGLDVGCGHGWSTDRLAKTGGRWAGLDISAAAIDAAQEIHPFHDYYHGDIRDYQCLPRHHENFYDVVVLSEILWYVLDRLDDAMANAARFCAPGGLLCVSQAFLKGEQRYGAEIANGFHGALKLFLERYPSLTLIEATYDDSGKLAHNHGLMVFRKPA